jgi:hypothetical protein
LIHDAAVAIWFIDQSLLKVYQHLPVYAAWLLFLTLGMSWFLDHFELAGADVSQTDC